MLSGFHTSLNASSDCIDLYNLSGSQAEATQCSASPLSAQQWYTRALEHPHQHVWGSSFWPNASHPSLPDVTVAQAVVHPDTGVAHVVCVRWMCCVCCRCRFHPPCLAFFCTHLMDIMGALPCALLHAMCTRTLPTVQASRWLLSVSP